MNRAAGGGARRSTRARWRVAAASLIVTTSRLVAMSMIAAVALGAQEPPPASSPLDLLHEATARQNAGDFPGAEALLQEALQKDATSLGALISMERLLRIDGHLDRMIPIVQAHLRAVPASPIGHQMLLRIYSDLDRPKEFDAAAHAWIEAAPSTETPYREIARLRELRGDTGGALETLLRGRERLGADALSLEIGATEAEVGRPDDAIRELAGAIGRDGAHFMAVRRRLSALPDGGASVMAGLVDALVRDPTSPARRRAAAELAVDAGLEAQAVRIAPRVAADLDGIERERFLVEISRRAESAQLPRVAFWGYNELLASGDSTLQPAALRGRIAELALLVGDTARARRGLEQAGDDGAVGDALVRRRAAAQEVRLALARSDADGARKAYAAFRGRFPRASENDALAADLARLLLRTGRDDDAQAVLDSASGPAVALVRARLELEAGKSDAARADYLAAAPGLYGADATDAIEIARLLGRITPRAGGLVGRALRLRDEGKAGEAAAALVAPASGASKEDEPVLLSFAARIAADGGLEGEAEQLWRTLIDQFPDALDTPAALLALGRALAERPESVAEAKQLLQKLVLEHPRSALAPQARRELERIDRRIPRS